MKVDDFYRHGLLQEHGWIVMRLPKQETSILFTVRNFSISYVIKI